MTQIDEALALSERDGRTLDRRFPAPHPRRDFAEARSGESRRPPRTPSSPPSRSRNNRRRGASSCSAALSLAKLYQSTNRAADAHAVLAPALEGFSPTPEFPEIAEAQALLAALAATDEVRTARQRADSG